MADPGRDRLRRELAGEPTPERVGGAPARPSGSRPPDRESALADLKRLSAAEHEAYLVWEEALDRLRVAALANSKHVLPRGHPAYLTYAEMAEAMEPPRDLSRPYWWCKQLLDDRDGIRRRIRQRLGRDPVPNYRLP